MANDLIIFAFSEGGEVRTVWRDGASWFVAVDVCRILDLDNSRQALSRLDDDEKGVISNDTLGGPQRTAIVSESGLYALVLSSRKPAARKFRKWVTSEVLPALRRDGAYHTSARGLKFSLSPEGRALRAKGRANFLAKPMWEREDYVYRTGKRFFTYEAWRRALDTGEF
jgi:prophage antirepressor-like protein